MSKMKTCMLTYENKSVEYHNFEAETLEECKRAFIARKSLIVAGPFSNIIIPIAVEMVLSYYTVDVFDENDLKRRPRLLLISKRSLINNIFDNLCMYTEDIIELCNKKMGLLIDYKYDVNLDMNDPYNGHLYWRHYLIKKYTKAGVPLTLPVHYLLPKISIYHDGRKGKPGVRDYLGVYDGQPPVFNLTSIPEVMNHIDDTDHIMCDYSYIPKNEIILSDKGIPIIHIFNSITDKRILKLQRAGIDLLAWTSGSLLKIENGCGLCQRAGKAVHSILNSRSIDAIKKRRVPSIIRCEDDIDEEFNQIGKYLKKIYGIIEKKKCAHGIRDIVKKSFYALRVMMALPVTPKEYDIMAGITGNTFAVEDLISELTVLSRTIPVRDEVLRANIYEMCKSFHNLDVKLSRRNKKMDKLTDLIRMNTAAGSRTAVLTVNSTAAEALKKHIYKKFADEGCSPENDKLHIMPFKKIKRSARGANAVDTLIVTDYNDGLFDDILLIPPAKEMMLLLYDEELRAVENIVNSLLNRITYLGRNNILNFDTELKHNTDGEYLKQISRSIRDVLKNNSRSTALQASLLETVNEICSEMDDGRYVSSYAFGGVSSSGEGGFVKAREITFNDSSRMLCGDEDRIRILNSANYEIETVGIDKLKRGDKVLIIKGNARNNLYDLIIEEIENQPMLDLDIKYIEYWQDCINEAFKIKDMTYEEVQKKLKDLGSDISSSGTVGNWIRGDIMGPSDPKDIERLGLILGRNELIRAWARIDTALKRIRSIHKIVARQLNKAIILSSGIGFVFDDETESLERFGLSIEDMRRTLAVKTVREISEETRYVRASDTGKNYN